MAAHLSPRDAVAQYEALVTQRLHPLAVAHARRLALARATRDEFEGLATTLTALEGEVSAGRGLAASADAALPPGAPAGSGELAGSALEALADLGAGFRAHARLEPTGAAGEGGAGGAVGTTGEPVVAVDVGAGLFVEMPLAQAAAVAATRAAAAAADEKSARAALAHVAVDLTIAISGLSALRQVGGGGGSSGGDGGGGGPRRAGPAASSSRGGGGRAWI
jgi:hypothetical protein